jgi:hypothetical protein
MNTSRLVGQTVEIKIASLDAAVSAVILGVETAGLWIHKGNVMETIAASRGETSSDAPKEPVVFLPFAQISWVMAESKESVYQKAR